MPTKKPIFDNVHTQFKATSYGELAGESLNILSRRDAGNQADRGQSQGLGDFENLNGLRSKLRYQANPVFNLGQPFVRRQGWKFFFRFQVEFVGGENKPCPELLKSLTLPGFDPFQQVFCLLPGMHTQLGKLLSMARQPDRHNRQRFYPGCEGDQLPAGLRDVLSIIDLRANNYLGMDLDAASHQLPEDRHYILSRVAEQLLP